ncbi:MAG TPA: hypothetical protein VL486_03695 [Verrucomicrobiae bacterium]|nr:hypothetical protein [Verrucomicrobiae bacterium]
MKSTGPSEAEIRERAYELFLERGGMTVKCALAPDTATRKDGGG